MIVRDMERFLGKSLTSLRGFVDEVVIGDTGSTDKLPEIARAHGASVIDISWKDNFVVAWNAVIDRVRGQWILTIDADKRVAPLFKGGLFFGASRHIKVGFLIHALPQLSIGESCGFLFGAEMRILTQSLMPQTNFDLM